MERYRPELIIRGGIVFLHGVVAVVCLVYLLNVFQKAFKCFPVAVLIQKRGEGLVEFVECFKSGEDVVGAAELLPHCVGHSDLSAFSGADFGGEFQSSFFLMMYSVFEKQFVYLQLRIGF